MFNLDKKETSYSEKREERKDKTGEMSGVTQHRNLILIISLLYRSVSPLLPTLNKLKP